MVCKRKYLNDCSVYHLRTRHVATRRHAPHCSLTRTRPVHRTVCVTRIASRTCHRSLTSPRPDTCPASLSTHAAPGVAFPRGRSREEGCAALARLSVAHAAALKFRVELGE